MVEQIGSGISRMKEEMEKAALPLPVFKTLGIFTIVFYRPVEKSSEKSSEKVLRLIKENPEISAEQLAKLIGISSRAIEKHIAKFKKQEIITRIGPDKGGYWEIIGS